jgi:hypothetical protein
MKKRVGVWIDHAEAVVVTLINGQEKTERVRSHAEGHLRLSGGARARSPYGPQDIASERKMQERRMHQLQRFYRDVAGAIRDADRIFILGPGEAKLEFEKQLRKSKELSAKLGAVETADRMTEAQMAATVRAFYKLPKRRR